MIEADRQASRYVEDKKRNVLFHFVLLPNCKPSKKEPSIEPNSRQYDHTMTNCCAHSDTLPTMTLDVIKTILET
jgi:hypothetical protein